MMTVPNAFSDLRRRIYFATRELMLQGRSLDGYRLVVSRDILAAALCDASDEMRAAYETNAEHPHLFGLPITFADRAHNYLALVHEVQA